jgi:hypothetical protein
MEWILFCNIRNSFDGVNTGMVEIEEWYTSIDITD